MKNQLQKLIACHTSRIKPRSVVLSFVLVTCSMAVFSESYTGKIVINGVVYGESGSNVTNGSGVKGKDRRQLGHFNSIRIDGSVNVNYTSAESSQAEIIGDQNLLPLITTQVNNGVLTISANESYQPQIPLTVELSSTGLQEVSLLGAGDINIRALDEKTFTLTLSGSGNASISGKAGQSTIQLSGSGDINAKDLISQHATAEITGSGNINLTVAELLSANIIGSGDIIYFGNPKKVEPQITGSGNVEAGN